MDYKYIEQILERYWQCETTLHEESILQSFFRQKDVPRHLRPYAHLFRRQEDLRAQALGKDFDCRLMARLGMQAGEMASHATPVRRISIFRRLRPLYQAAGLVALIITIGTAAQRSMGDACEACRPAQSSLQGQAAGEEGAALRWDGEGHQACLDDSAASDEDEVKPLNLQHAAAMRAQEPDTLDYTR